MSSTVAGEKSCPRPNAAPSLVQRSFVLAYVTTLVYESRRLPFMILATLAQTLPDLSIPPPLLPLSPLPDLIPATLPPSYLVVSITPQSSHLTLHQHLGYIFNPPPASLGPCHITAASSPSLPSSSWSYGCSCNIDPYMFWFSLLRVASSSIALSCCIFTCLLLCG
ncbi:hypothetical protein BD310DRAFT_631794 [Dichomitus squalens]|uniref:Uncharacterized protein n=1 Tax=Dichomitus squalens TaxID=114155 RepID=A0A4Q9PPH7_9APHY|nr:hypothetical protein BD310DRAFT_631794 [Dichomitus squalens]